MAEDLESLSQKMKAGGILAYPTETVWGLGVDIDNVQAVDRLFDLKGRATTKAMTVLVSDRRMAARLSEFDEETGRLMDLFWPGPVTFVLKKKSSVTDTVTGGGDTVGLRCSSHPWVRKFMAIHQKPITTTSANRSGEMPATQLSELKLLADKKSSLLVAQWDQPCLGVGSTVVRKDGKKWIILREGDLPGALFLRAVAGI